MKKFWRDCEFWPVIMTLCAVLVIIVGTLLALSYTGVIDSVFFTIGDGISRGIYYGP